MGFGEKIKSYEQDGKAISRFELKKQIRVLKDDYEWLKELTLNHYRELPLIWKTLSTNFSEKLTGFPKFKSKKNPVQSFSVPQYYKVDFENNNVYIPKIGWIKSRIHRRSEGKCKTTTITRTLTGKYHISILVDDEKSITSKTEIAKQREDFQHNLSNK